MEQQINNDYRAMNEIPQEIISQSFFSLIAIVKQYNLIQKPLKCICKGFNLQYDGCTCGAEQSKTDRIDGLKALIEGADRTISSVLTEEKVS